MQQARQTAYKVWIANLLNGQYIKQAGEWTPNYVSCQGQKVSRVNILATVIAVEFGENFGSITLDDGSATMQVRAFKEDVGVLREVNMGDLITVIGRPREFQNTIYIIPEIIKKVENPKWLLVRKVEIEKLFGKPQKAEQKQAVAQQTTNEVVVTTETVTTTSTQAQQETPPTESKRQLILNLVEKASEAGITLDTLPEKTNLPEKETEFIVQELLKEGEIYMPRPGQVKIV